MSELREYQEEYIALEEKQKEMEINITAIKSTKEGNARLLPRIT